jgi:two-component system, OmpR family, response regulator
MTRVLMIDDEPSLTRLWKLALESNGQFEVRTANTGRAGIALAREFHPDVVLLDIVLPDLNAGEVCAELGDTPVIFLTALFQSSRNIAGHPVLAKPVKLQTLTASLEAATRRSSTPPTR